MNTTKITSSKFGFYKGQTINQYLINNANGMTVSIIDFGATITDIQIPVKKNIKKSVACGFDTLEGYFSESYVKNAPYFGCTVGRYASRIKDGKFSINDQEYTLAVNDGSNHLHGGLVGFNKKIWSGSIVDRNGHPSVKMQLISPHLEEGYPGKVEVSVWFILTDNNELDIQYEATTDHPTPLSLTNHTYFNLSGFEQTIEQVKASISSNRILLPDDTNVPIGNIESIENTPADLQTGKVLKDSLQKLETGFEHYYLFNNPESKLKKVARFSDENSGVVLDISTTEPGALFYTGYFTSSELMRENGLQYGRFRGFCFETSRYPNGPNIPDSPGSITHPGELYSSQTVFKLMSNVID
jgi:aldose 1-epimerase